MGDECKLINKLAEIRKMSDVAKKEKSGFKYKYVDIVEILAKVTAGMKKYRVSLIPMIVPGTAEVTKQVFVNTVTDRTGSSVDKTTTEMVVYAEMLFRWVDDETGETLDVPWFVIGSQADPSQAFGSGLTYCTRYFLTNYFQIAQPEDDVDAYRSKQQAAENAENLAIAQEIITKVDAAVRAYLDANPDQKETVKKFMTRYVKDGNYRLIKEPAMAAKLMSDFTSKFSIDITKEE